LTGVLLGLACGLTELWLLRKLIGSIPKGRIPVWVVPAKMAALALFFIPCALLAPAQLGACGLAAAAALILGALASVLFEKKAPAQAKGEQP